MPRTRVRVQPAPTIDLSRSGIPAHQRTTHIVLGNVLDTLSRLPTNRIQTCITSPPYWALRDYGHPDQLGSEPTPEQYVENMVRVFEGVRRILRDDGTLWLNLGDCYASQPLPNHKPKDLVGIPWLTAFALQRAGWYFRSDIVWAKNVVMPESVNDRPTRSHEFVFLFSKSPTYYYDQEAVRQPAKRRWASTGGSLLGNTDWHEQARGSKTGDRSTYINTVDDTMRNQRDVWTINPKPYKGAHFAVFPTELVRDPIKAATSEHGCCPECFAPYTRQIELHAHGMTESEREEHTRSRSSVQAKRAAARGIRPRGGANYIGSGAVISQHRTTGWEPTCECGHEERAACMVLDTFGGSGTTALVANGHGRDAVICELNPEYAALAQARVHNDAPFINRVFLVGE